MFYNDDTLTVGPFNQDISSWNVSNVDLMHQMFRNTAFNQDISSWNVSNVTGMHQMFRNTPFNQDISSWDVSSVTNMNGMFMNTPFNQDISSWDVTLVTNMNGMFDDANQLSNENKCAIHTAFISLVSNKYWLYDWSNYCFVNVTDLLNVIKNWGNTTDDGFVDVSDLLEVIGS